MFFGSSSILRPFRPLGSLVGAGSASSSGTVDGIYTFSALDSFMTEHQRDLASSRIKRYKFLMRIYDGDFNAIYNDGENYYRAFDMNYSQVIVNKICDWMSMAGWELTAPEGNSILCDYLNYIWEANKKDSLYYRLCVCSSIYGDIFVLPLIRTTDVEGNELKPSEWRLEIRVINPMYVHPIISPDTKEMLRCVIQYPVIVSKKLKDDFGSAVGNEEVAHYTLIYTPSLIYEYMNAVPFANSPRENTLGFIPVVHIPNYLRGNSIFGISDIETIVDLSRDYNDIGHRLKRIVDYFAEPITLVYGARVKDHVRGSDKVWSNLPVDSRVENLTIPGDNMLCKTTMDLVRDSIYITSNTPKTSVGEVQEATNLTKAGLSAQYMPLMEKKHRKWITHKEGIEKINQIILLLTETVFEKPLEELFPSIENIVKKYHLEVEQGSPFDEDEETALRILETKYRLGIISKAEMLRQQHYKNRRQIAREIIADARADMLVAVEQSQASAGNLPNLNAFVLNSMAVDNKVVNDFLIDDEKIIDSTLLMREYRNTLKSINEEQMQQIQIEAAQEEAEKQKEMEDLKNKAVNIRKQPKKPE